MRVLGAVTLKAFKEQIGTLCYLFITFLMILFVIILPGTLFSVDKLSVMMPFTADANVHVLIYVVMFMLLLMIIGCGAAVGKSVHQERRTYKLKLNEGRKSFILLLVGTIVGIGMTGVLQLLILTALTLFLVHFWDLKVIFLSHQFSLDLRHLTLSMSMYCLLFFVLGYVQYAWLYVSMNSLMKRNRTGWISFIVILLFMASTGVVLIFPSLQYDLVLKMSSMMPYVSPLLMVIRVSTEKLTFFQWILPVIIMIGSIWIGGWCTFRFCELSIRRLES